MKNKPLISIIITNYNYGQYITKAINSILNQTYPNIELIIINDGSTDDSDAIIKSIIANNRDRNIKYITRENKGVVYTRNEGMRLAKGEFISYLDADDYFNRNYISKSYKIATTFGVDVVYPNWHFVGEWLGHPDTDFPEFTSEKLQLQQLHCTPASLIRKSAIEGHYFEVEKVAEDWDFFVGLSLKGRKFKLASDNYINYRIRQGTRGSQNDPKDDTEYFVEILEKYKKIYGDKVIDPQRLVKLRHPNIVKRVLSMRYPRVVIQSIQKDGVKTTAIKITGKIASRNQWVWRTVGYVRNKKYQHMTRSFMPKNSPNTKLAIVLHLYYPDAWPVIREKLKNINIPFDMFVSVQSKDRDFVLGRVNKYHKATSIAVLPNRGRDVLPFLIVANKLKNLTQYKYLLKLHSKKSLHRSDGSEWLESLLDQLIPSDISNIIKTLEEEDTGAVGPADHITSLSRYMGENRSKIRNILESVSDNKTTNRLFSNLSRYPFFGGTMFWCRLDFIEPLLKSPEVTAASFNSEHGQVDGTTAHAMERVFGLLLHAVEGKKMYILKDSIVTRLPEKPYTAKYKFVH